MVDKDSDSNMYAFLAATLIVAVLLYRYLTEIQKFEYNAKAFVLSLFTLNNIVIIISIILGFLIIQRIMNKRRVKREAEEWQERERLFKKEELKAKRKAIVQAFILDLLFCCGSSL